MCAISVTNPDVVFIKVAYFVGVWVGVHASVHTCASLQSCMCVMLDLTHCSNLSDDTHLMLVTVHTYDSYIFFIALHCHAAHFLNCNFCFLCMSMQSLHFLKME